MRTRGHDTFNVLYSLYGSQYTAIVVQEGSYGGLKTGLGWRISERELYLWTNLSFGRTRRWRVTLRRTVGK